MKNIIFAFICVALHISFASGQIDNPKENSQSPSTQLESKRAEMKKLDGLVGQWKGSGWVMQEKGKETFTGTETVQRKIDGLALLVEGNFKNKEGVITHETLAVLSPNLKTKSYDFRTYLASGLTGEHEFKAVENGWRWGFQFPSGIIRYDIKTENDTWIETGELSRDGGKTWVKIFEMSLKKVK